MTGTAVLQIQPFLRRRSAICWKQGKPLSEKQSCTSPAAEKNANERLPSFSPTILRRLTLISQNISKLLKSQAFLESRDTGIISVPFSDSELNGTGSGISCYLTILLMFSAFHRSFPYCCRSWKRSVGSA